MAKRDYYQVLGVGKSADPATIKSAYRKLAMKYHPDRNGGDSTAEARFREATEAYDVLRDQQKRAAYDQFGHSAFDAAGNGAGFGGFQHAGGFDAAGFDTFDEIFSTFFGGGHRTRGGHDRESATPGEDVRYDMEVSLEEAFSGCSRQITLEVYQGCVPCNNTGVAGGGQPSVCETCNGVGQIRRQQGFFSILRACPKCQGAGKIISDPCKTCGGDGRTRKNKTIKIKIPPGVDTDTRMTIRGEGHAGVRSGLAGNLYVMIRVTPHPLFTRRGNTLALSVPVAMTTAALGGDVDIPTLDGKLARVAVAPGTQSGEVLRLREKGMPHLHGRGTGDMLVEIEVETPSRLTAQQQQLLREFAEGEIQHHPRVQEFASRTKQFFQNK